MEKTKDQILIEKLRKAGRLTRGGHRPHGPACHRGPHGPGADGPRPPFAPGMGGPHGGPRPVFPRELILLALLDADGGVRQKDLAGELGINPSSLSEQIDRLEADRYLERTANPEDKRSTLITLTEKGRARAYEVTNDRQRRAAEFCGRLSEEEKDQLIALLEKLLDTDD